MNRDQALSKIKKCLALAQSSNPHEAAAAMRQAQKLMAEHNVTETDVSLADVAEAVAPARLNALTNWEAMLSGLIAQAFGCDHFSRISRHLTKTARGDEFAFGWVCGVRGLVESFAGTEHNQQLIEQYMAARYPDLRTKQVKDRAKGRNVSHNDMSQGRAAGMKAELNRGVGGMAQQGLLS